MHTPLDAELFAALMRLPALPFLRLLAPRRAARFDVAAYRDALAAFRARIDTLSTHPAVALLYHAKADELALRADCIDAVKRGDDAGVTAASLALYGQPRVNRQTLQAHLEEMCAHAGKRKTRIPVWITAEMFAAMARRLLAAYGLTDWRIQTSTRSALHVGHTKRLRTPLLRIPTSLRITPRRAAQLLAHEVETHVLRHANGERSPLLLLGRGTAGYLQTDEGLAMYNQQQLSRNTRHWPGFWEAYAAALAREYDGRETHRILAAARTRLAARMGHDQPEALGQSAATRLCKRLYRGIASRTTPGVGFFRDHVYLSGYEDIRTWTATHDVSELYVGHVALHDLDRVRELGITTTLAPQFLAKSIVDDALAAH